MSLRRIGIFLGCLLLCSAAESSTRMSYVYSGDETNYPLGITLPQGSDLKNVSTLDVPLEALSDRTAFLAAKGWGSLSQDYYPNFIAHQALGEERFSLQSLVGVGFGWVQYDVSDAGALVIPLIQVPAYGVLTNVRVYLACDAAHSLMPATKPQITLLYETPATKQSPIVVDTAVDPSTTVAAYEALHFIDITLGGGNILDQTYPTAPIYYLIFNGETGANSVGTSLVLKGMALTFNG